ncbi:hypothetical protein L0P88_04110 [Muricauda sp. SCSIO 64092]|uniref:hypothetical protein n=1 Tax=Allomuricauda sp. SCSIO 64092 TaxID=2908842 RepID=UPI001FF5DC8F|nr:hypothetical protein [Muricauda sp. SCSIO 64092]UOY07739.1 hypothetical protein L0P88_04110 [Muricauda sp. SCSIO 64092]
MEQIKTFEDACKVLGLDPEKVIPDFSMFQEEHQKAMVAHAKLVIIAQALNGDWKPDWGNREWDKYCPWFSMGGSSGSGFAPCDSVSWRSRSGVGSRLCFKSSEIAKYAGKQFEELYKDYFLIQY